MSAMMIVFFAATVTGCFLNCVATLAAPDKPNKPLSQLGSLLSSLMCLNAIPGQVSPTATPPSLPPADNLGDSQ